MSTTHPFVISVLSKQDLHPLEASAKISGETMFDLASSNKGILNVAQVNIEPPKSNSVVIYKDLAIPDKDTLFWEGLPPLLKIPKSKIHKSQQSLRNSLWQKVNWREKRADAQFARLFELSIPHWLDEPQIQTMVKSYAQSLANEGMVVDIGIKKNAPKSNNETEQKIPKITAQLLTTMRPFTNGEFSNKNRTWNERDTLFRWRKQWFELLSNVIEHTEDNPAKDIWRQLCEQFLSKGSLNKEPQQRSEDRSTPQIETDEGTPLRRPLNRL